MLLMTIGGDPNIGIFCLATDKFCLLPNTVEKNDFKKIESDLKVECFKAKLVGSDLLGIFSVANSNGILFCNLVSEKEIKFMKEKLKKFDINFGKIKLRYTAIGNLILCNDKGAIISELIGKRERKRIEDILGVETSYGRIANLKIVGACGIATNKGCLLHRDAKEEEIKLVEDVLKVNSDIGTVNFGSPFVGSAIIANSFGVIIGERSSPPEIARIMEALNL